MIVATTTPATVVLPHLSDHLFNCACRGTSRKPDEEIVVVSERNLFLEAERQHKSPSDENCRERDAGLRGEDLSENIAIANLPRSAHAKGRRSARLINHTKRPMTPSTFGPFFELGHLYHELARRPAIIRVQKSDVRAVCQRQARVSDQSDVTRMRARYHAD